MGIFDREKVKLSARYGFLGLGMGGTSIANQCAEIRTNIPNLQNPYTGLLINTNSVDLDKIKTSNPSTLKLLIGNGKGAARETDVAQNIFSENKEKIKEAIIKQFKDVDFLWIVAGLGGGTGTGTLISAIQTILELETGLEDRIGLIITLPRAEEGSLIVNNALMKFQQIVQASSLLGSVILIDNELLYTRYLNKQPNATVREYLDYSNRFIANALHELNLASSSFLPYGSNHFDAAEFLKLIKTPGFLHLARVEIPSGDINTSSQQTYISPLLDAIQNGVLSNGYELVKTKRMALNVIADQSTSRRIFNYELNDSLEKIVNQLAPLADEKPVSQYTYEVNEKYEKTKTNKQPVYFYAVFAGLDFPTERLTNLAQENLKIIEEQNKLQEQSSSENKLDIFSALNKATANKKEENTNKAQALSQLLGNKEEDKENNSKPSKAQLFDAFLK